MMPLARKLPDVKRTVLVVGGAGCIGSLAGNVLGWKPEITDLKDIIRTAWDWMRLRQC